MTHWTLLYYFITFSIGIISFGIAAVLFAKTHERVLQYYLYFYTPFTVLVLANVLRTYISANVPTIHPYIYAALNYIESPVALYLLLFTTPLFIHHLFLAPDAHCRNIIIGGLSLGLFILKTFVEHVVNDDGTLERISDVITDTVFMAIMLYVFLIGRSFYKKLSDAARKQTAKKLLTLFGAFLPGIFNDTMLSEISPIQFFPLLYCGFSLIFTHHFLTYSQTPAPEPPVPDIEKTVPADDFFAHYNISHREKELIVLILKGYSNPQIAETLFISLSTVKTHLSNIYSKFNLKSRYELITFLNAAEETRPSPSKDSSQ